MGCDEQFSNDHVVKMEKYDQLRKREYYPATYHSLGSPSDPQIHKPCGLVVGDPDTHDKYCPARGSI